ncbi:MAG: metallophosphoesterase [Clostridiales bacterium]|nr:metallophosphoesterase [Clostridiales bacterium]
MAFWIIGGLILLGLAVLLISNSILLTSEHEIPIKELPQEMDGMRILHLSDLHSARYGRKNRRLSAKIRAIHPDYILCTGDMMDKYTKSGDPFLELLRGLQGEFPMFASIGNHELRVKKKAEKNYQDFIRQAGELGVCFIDNNQASLQYRGKSLCVYGLTLPLPVFYEHAEPEPVERYLGENPEHPNLLLAHDPRWLSEYAKWGADLVLSGHLHGGLIRLPLIGGLISPGKTLFPQYDAGLFQKGNTQMYVTRGTGDSGKRRILSFPELAVLTLRCEKGGNQ